MRKKIIWNYIFTILNKNYWGSKYRTVPVFMRDLDKDMLGEYECTPEGFNCIVLAKNHDLNNREMMGVLLHEMCHHVVFENYGINIEVHGEEWIKEMKKVGFIGNITKLTDGLNKFSQKEFDNIIAEYDYLYKKDCDEIRGFS